MKPPLASTRRGMTAPLATIFALTTVLTLTPTLLTAHGMKGRHHESMAGMSHDQGTGPLGILSLDLYVTGSRLHRLTGVNDGGTRPELYYAFSDDGGKTWANLVRVDVGCAPAAGLGRGMDAQLAVSGKHLVAVWQTAGSGSWGGGPMVTALSSDGGLTWRPGPNPADDGLINGHNFIALCADPTGGFHLTWLDNRGGQRGLRYASSRDGGAQWSQNVTVDPETCECCWNTIRADAHGRVWILYRDKDPRDMHVAMSVDAGAHWQSAGIAPFDWNIQACPHTGGGLVVASQQNGVPQLGAIAWTGKKGARGLYYVRSADGGATWAQPELLSQTAWHADLAQGHGAAVVVWDAMGDGIFGICSTDGGTTWSRPALISNELSAKAGAQATHPRVVATPAGFVVFWTTTEGKTAQLEQARFPCLLANKIGPQPAGTSSVDRATPQP